MTQLSTTFKNKLAQLLAHNAAIAGFGDASVYNLLQPLAAYISGFARMPLLWMTTPEKQAASPATLQEELNLHVVQVRLDVTTNVISNAADIEVVADAGYVGTENIQYAELWLNNSGSTEADRIFHCELSQVIAMTAGKTFRIAAGGLTFPVN